MLCGMVNLPLSWLVRLDTMPSAIVAWAFAYLPTLRSLPTTRCNNLESILDWDVHHGNGTQALVEHHPQIAYCSLHEFPNYPGTGRTTERGAFCNVLNLPMPPGSTITDYEPLFSEQILPFFQTFQPDLLIVSAGYDANASDPLSGINLLPEDYAVFTHHCLQLTRQIVFGLEGGYDFPSLSQSVAATISACLG